MNEQRLLLELNNCVILFNQLNDSVLEESVFINLMIKMNNILQSLSKDDKRNTDKPTKQYTNGIDITDLINKMRNAVCHIDSKDRYLTETDTELVFNKFIGSLAQIKIGEVIIGSEFEDDIAFNYGSFLIYLKRDIERCLKKIREQLAV